MPRLRTVGDGARRDRPAGALVARQVAGRGLDVHGRLVDARARPRSPRAWRPGGRRASGARRSPRRRRSPAAGPRRRAARRPRAAAPSLAIAARRPGVRREQAAEVAQAGRAEERVGDGMQHHVAVGVAGEARAHRRSRCRRGGAGVPGRTGGCRGRTRRGPCRARARRSTRRRSSGSVTLRFAGSPGIAWTGMVQASSRAASSVNSRGPSGGNAIPGVEQQPAARALGRLGGGERRTGPRSRAPSRPPTRLSVSATGSTGSAAPCRSHGLGDRRPRAPTDTSGRAPSWTSTGRSPPPGSAASS